MENHCKYLIKHNIWTNILLASCHHGHDLRISSQMLRDGQLPSTQIVSLNIIHFLSNINISTYHSQWVHHNVQARPKSNDLNGRSCVSLCGGGPVTTISHHLPVIVPFSDYSCSKDLIHVCRICSLLEEVTWELDGIRICVGLNLFWIR